MRGRREWKKALSRDRQRFPRQQSKSRISRIWDRLTGIGSSPLLPRAYGIKRGREEEILLRTTRDAHRRRRERQGNVWGDTPKPQIHRSSRGKPGGIFLILGEYEIGEEGRVSPSLLPNIPALPLTFFCWIREVRPPGFKGSLP